MENRQTPIFFQKTKTLDQTWTFGGFRMFLSPLEPILEHFEDFEKKYQNFLDFSKISKIQKFQNNCRKFSKNGHFLKIIKFATGSVLGIIKTF